MINGAAKNLQYHGMLLLAGELDATTLSIWHCSQLVSTMPQWHQHCLKHHSQTSWSLLSNFSDWTMHLHWICWTQELQANSIASKSIHYCRWSDEVTDYMLQAVMIEAQSEIRLTDTLACVTWQDFTPNLVLHFPVLHFPPSDLHIFVVLHFLVITFTPIVLHWSSFFRSSIFSQPGKTKFQIQMFWKESEKKSHDSTRK